MASSAISSVLRSAIQDGPMDVSSLGVSKSVSEASAEEAKTRQRVDTILREQLQSQWIGGNLNVQV